MEKRLIYALKCPFTDEVHYIGKSSSGMIRPLQHLTQSHSEKINEWVNELKRLGYAPNVEVVQYVSLNEDIDGIEQYWILHYIEKGNTLLNLNSVTPLTISKYIDDLKGDEIDSAKVISQFIKHRRKLYNITQGELASKAGVALTVVRKIEQCDTNYNITGLLSILKMFGCTIGISRIKLQTDTQSDYHELQ